MSFCYHPWTGLEIEADGTIRPCCKFRPELFPNWPGFNIKQGLDSYFNSKALKDFQDQFEQGKKPEACIRCWRDEAAGLASKRQMDMERWQGQLNKEHVQFLTLPIGNLCNLKCRICGPVNSSAWIGEWQQLFGNKMPIQDWHKDPNIWRDIIAVAKDCLEIHIHGGEPFLYENKEHVDMIKQLVETGHSKNIRLHYNTNGTVMPDVRLWDYWREFKWVDIQVSIDDYGYRFEYNRFPAKWNDVKQNLLEYKTKPVQLSIATTVSAFTVGYLDDFFTHIMDLGLPKPWLGRLQMPAHYRVGVLPVNLRATLKTQLLTSKHEDVRAAAVWLDEDDSIHTPIFRKITAWQDNYRQQKFVDVFPELASIMDE